MDPATNNSSSAITSGFMVLSVPSAPLPFVRAFGTIIVTKKYKMNKPPRKPAAAVALVVDMSVMEKRGVRIMECRYLNKKFLL